MNVIDWGLFDAVPFGAITSVHVPLVAPGVTVNVAPEGTYDPGEYEHTPLALCEKPVTPTSSGPG